MAGQPGGGFRLSSRGFAGALLVLIAAKLWLVHAEDVRGSATEFDALWYVNSAKHWYWWTPYSWTAFVRPAAYPLWVALVHAVGLPLRLALELLQIGAYLALVLALRAAAVPRSVCLVSFAALCFHPFGIFFNNYTMADTFYAPVLSFVLAGWIALIVTPRIGIAIATGGALAILWNTREESAVLLATWVCFLGIWLGRERLQQGDWRSALRRVSKPALAMIATCALLVVSVYAMNYQTFYAFAKSEMTSRAFQSAFAALLRIKPEAPQRFVPITAESMQKAAAVSPAFARLHSRVAGPLGESWRTETFNRTGVRGEIGVNWLMWSLRQSANEMGFHAAPKKARQFYRRVAQEIKRACVEKRVPSRRIIGSFVDPLSIQGLEFLPQSFSRISALFVAQYEMLRTRDEEILLPHQSALYDEMTARRSVENWPKPEEELSFAVENLIGRYHRYFLIALVCLALGASGILAWRFRFVSWSEPLWAVIALLAVAILLRVALFTFLDATSWPCDDGRFVFPVSPLFSVLLLLLIYQAMRVLRPGTARAR